MEKPLASLFPLDWVVATAKETGFVRRIRNVHPYSSLWNLVLCFGVHVKLKLALLHQSHEEISARQPSRTSFYEHFSPALSAFLDRCIERALSLQLEHSAIPLSEELTLSAVRDIVTIDSTLITLNDKLVEEFPNARSTNCPAAAKLNVRFSVPSRELDAFRIAPGKASESSLLEIGDWVEGRLVLYDLGYFKIDDFVKINDKGGFFVSRLKRNADPLLLASLNSGRGKRTGSPPIRWPGLPGSAGPSRSSSSPSRGPTGWMLSPRASAATWKCRSPWDCRASC